MGRKGRAALHTWSAEDDAGGWQCPGYLHFPKGLTKEEELPVFIL